MTETAAIQNVLMPLISRELDKVKKGKNTNAKLTALLKMAEETGDKALIKRANELIEEDHKSVMVDFATAIKSICNELKIPLVTKTTTTKTTTEGEEGEKRERATPEQAKAVRELVIAEIKKGLKGKGELVKAAEAAKLPIKAVTSQIAALKEEGIIESTEKGPQSKLRLVDKK